ncbi:MAG: RidA family protein [Acidimicrobiales bacterium]
MSNDLTHEQRLTQSGLELPAALPAFGQYVPAVLHRDHLWLGGHFGTRPDGSLHTGRCGQDATAAEARDAARSAAINMLATARDTLGSLDRVEQVAQLHGVVNATPDFVEHTSVIDAASDVLVEVFGESGRHTRLAVGVASLPANLLVEIQALFTVAPWISAPPLDDER